MGVSFFVNCNVWRTDSGVKKAPLIAGPGGYFSPCD